MSVFWDIKLCRPLKVNGALYASALIIPRFRKQRTLLAAWFMLVYYLAYSPNLKMEMMCSPKRRLTSGLHGVISQKI
jgi:hypothetical protein